MDKGDLVARAHFINEVVSVFGFIFLLLACFSGMAGAWSLFTVSVVLFVLALITAAILLVYYRYLLRQPEKRETKSG